MKKFVEKSSNGSDVKNIWAISRPQEQSVFTTHIGNKRMLFHGSSAKNWVGILSRGLLMPKTVVSLGVKRTDAGWLGNGIYFGDVATTSLQYAGAGKRGTSFLSLVEVALGKMKEYKDITYGLTKPPDGYDSCHGNPRGDSEFADDEYVIYNPSQQRLQYLVEVEGY
jgi:poly [ADP-ribose] polymerase